MTVVGGLRDRLLKDSFYAQVEQALNTLGWLDPSRAHRPITLTDKANHWDIPVAPNTVTVDFTNATVDEWEVGSTLTQDVHIGYVEIYAENDSLGVHLSNDLRDWFRGRLQQGLIGATFPIYDFRQGSTPPVVGHMDLSAVSSLRNVVISEEVWLQHWFRVRCLVRDTYSGLGMSVPYPDPDLFPTGALYPAG